MGNLALVQTSQGAIGNQHPRENLRNSATLGALNSEVVLVCDGCSSFGIDLRGAFSLSIELSGTIDGTNWTPIPVLPVNQVSRLYVTSIAGSNAGVWEGKCAPYWKIRARCTAYTSGAATVTISTSVAALDNSFRNMTSNALTVLGAVGAITTLTLPAPGTGLRQYLTNIRIDRFATALLIAAASPTTVTTSNLPNALAFSIAADAALQGSIASSQIDYAYPLAASTQNGAVTIVAPATLTAIWRLTAGYFVAP